MNAQRMTRLSLVLVGCLVGLWQGGCAAREQYQGQRGLVGTYRGGTLTAVLPPETRVPAVVAAAEAMFKDRGYAVAQSSSTEDAGRVIARPPRYSSYPRMFMAVDLVENGTRVQFTYEPLGNEEVCRASLDALLKRLGM
ncbi:MAG: hypothetical protein ACOYN0_09955 [Phycisphaerales bacterium]